MIKRVLLSLYILLITAGCCQSLPYQPSYIIANKGAKKAKITEKKYEKAELSAASPVEPP